MNIQRFFTLPNGLKPIILFIIFLVMIIAGATKVQDKQSESGAWFFWITIIVQLMVMAAVVILFLFELELLATCGKDQWPIFEMAYSVTFAIVDIINMFVVAGWSKVTTSHAAPIVAALFLFAMVIIYALGAIMMFRTWKGFVQSGASQNPTGNVQPGNVGNMHPGV